MHPNQVTIDFSMTLGEANTLVKALHRVIRHSEGTDNSIHATTEERRAAARDAGNAREMLERLGAYDSDPEGQT